MPNVHRSIEIKAPIKEVYDYIDNPEKDPEWMTSMVEVHNVKGSGVGRQFDWTYKMVGVPLKGESIFTEDVPEKHIVVKTKGSVESTWTFNLESREDYTMLDLDIDYRIPVPVVGKLAEKVLMKRNERETEMSLTNIKERLESQAWRGKERRDQMRNRVDLPCDVKGISHGKETTETAHVVDLNQQGMYVAAPTPLDEGTEMDAQITAVQFGNTFWVKGKVLRSSENGMAIRFTGNVPREIEGLMK